QEVEVFVDGAFERLPADRLELSYRRAVFPPGAIVTRARLRLTRSDPDAVARRLEAVDGARKGQPKVKSAGCAFQNPAGDSAGRLIDEAGLKGLRVGDAMVAHEHGNFILNLGAATATDVRTLIAEVQSSLAARGVELELEWRLWGF
ncbi:MAG TPA: UDP-N-acetylmuramate dehydrogenase, partial [Trueperaceae bacterium]|nr:UDP-N-acetylmuramate dehydrogenase [Trueperaceae bacterium]